jgi:hypothetical protein
VDVLEALTHELAERTAAGVAFDTAWPIAIRVAIEGVEDEWEHDGWLTALSDPGVVAVWRAAFERRPPSRRERSLTLLLGGPHERTPMVRVCERCGTPLPATARATRRFCSKRCTYASRWSNRDDGPLAA